MIQFEKPSELNGSQLRDELRNVKINISDEFNAVLVDGNDKLWLNIAEKDAAKAAEVVAKHVGTDQRPQIEAQRNAILERLGLTAEDVALLLR